MEDDSGPHGKGAGRQEELQAILEEIRRLAVDPPTAIDPEGLERLEEAVVKLTNRVGRFLTGGILQASLDSKELADDIRRLMKEWPGRLRNEGRETVQVRTLHGQEVSVQVGYHRKKGRRAKGKRHAGVYAGLFLLGIHERCSPGLSAEIALLTAAMSSLEEARLVLKERGIVLDIKTIRSVAYRFARRARLIHQAVDVGLGCVAGRRVVISCDGGRVRIRNDKRGRKTRKGRTRYKADWREPKLLIIYLVDGEGQNERCFAPLIDGTMKGPDALFALLRLYLDRLEITRADRILFVADGAPWIWKRWAEAVSKWGLNAEQSIELVDFYHAVEHLGKVAALRKKWSVRKRKQWVTSQRRLLLKGEVSRVIEAVRSICRGRNSKEIRAHRNYFVKNASRMDYANVKAMKMPLGSGAVESAIRRVVNLRLKGAGIYWHEASAEAMLMLRAFFKAGRWNQLKRMANPTFFNSVA